MNWLLRNINTQDCIDKSFDSRDAAAGYLQSMGAAFVPLYEAIPDTADENQFRMLTEGLVAGDLRHIVLPQVSIDEYVPGDPDTDNIVAAFFIKGVPEAVIPFRDFIMKTGGILDVAYGDSDTIPNTSIIYVEMARSGFQFDTLNTLMEYVGLLSNLEPADFSVVFPTSQRKYPYSQEVIEDYFTSRTIKQNLQAQQAAMDKADGDQETTGASQDETDSINKDEAAEAMVEFIVEQF